MASRKSWLKFFADAGIPPSESALYAVKFYENRIQQGMLVDLNKEYLKEMGITMMGDIINILKHAKKVYSELSESSAISLDDDFSDSSVERMVTEDKSKKMVTVSTKEKPNNNGKTLQSVVCKKEMPNKPVTVVKSVLSKPVSIKSEVKEVTPVPQVSPVARRSPPVEEVAEPSTSAAVVDKLPPAKVKPGGMVVTTTTTTTTSKKNDVQVTKPVDSKADSKCTLEYYDDGDSEDNSDDELTDDDDDNVQVTIEESMPFVPYRNRFNNYRSGAFSGGLPSAMPLSDYSYMHPEYFMQQPSSFPAPHISQPPLRNLYISQPATSYGRSSYEKANEKAAAEEESTNIVRKVFAEEIPQLMMKKSPSPDEETKLRSGQNSQQTSVFRRLGVRPEDTIMTSVRTQRAESPVMRQSTQPRQPSPLKRSVVKSTKKTRKTSTISSGDIHRSYKSTVRSTSVLTEGILGNPRNEQKLSLKDRLGFPEVPPVPKPRREIVREHQPQPAPPVEVRKPVVAPRRPSMGAPKRAYVEEEPAPSTGMGYRAYMDATAVQKSRNGTYMDLEMEKARTAKKVKFGTVSEKIIPARGPTPPPRDDKKPSVFTRLG